MKIDSNIYIPVRNQFGDMGFEKLSVVQMPKYKAKSEKDGIYKLDSTKVLKLA